ncbi:type III secretion system effector BopA family protein [Burkholderia sp. DN3021]|uniref:type III secretion system effector BopA family protein n=1 Tax=Burkholderia sp. DN3021 TaxID=3410137 RepID=UPI003C7EA010
MTSLQLNAFRTVQAHDTQRLQVGSSQNAPTVQVAKEGFGGRILSWFGQWPIFHRIEAVKSHMDAIQVQNKEVLAAFVSALAPEYGDITAHSAEPLLEVETGCKPLTQRVIRQVESFAQACRPKEAYFAELSERFGDKIARQAFAMQELMLVDRNHASVGRWTEKPLEEPVKTTLLTLASTFEETAIHSSVKCIDKANSLKTLDGPDLRKSHGALASGNGALRSLLTGLDGLAAIKGLTGAPEFVQTLRNVQVAGMPFSEWGTTGGKVEAWLQSATPDQLDQAATRLRQIASEIPELSRAAQRYLDGDVSTLSRPRFTEQTWPTQGSRPALELVNHDSTAAISDIKVSDIKVTVAGNADEGLIGSGARGRVHRTGDQVIKSFKTMDKTAIAHELAMCNSHLKTSQRGLPEARMEGNTLVMPYIAGETPTMDEAKAAVRELFDLGFMMGDPSPANFVKTASGSVVPVDFGLMFKIDERNTVCRSVMGEIVHDFIKGGYKCVPKSLKHEYLRVMGELGQALGKDSPVRKFNVKNLMAAGWFNKDDLKLRTAR